jgi:hypothetical protein
MSTPSPGTQCCLRQASLQMSWRWGSRGEVVLDLDRSQSSWWVDETKRQWDKDKGHEEAEAELRVVGPQAKDHQSHQELEEAGMILPWSLWGEPTPWLQILDLWGVNFCYFTSLVLFWHLREEFSWTSSVCPQGLPCEDGLQVACQWLPGGTHLWGRRGVDLPMGSHKATKATAPTEGPLHIASPSKNGIFSLPCTFGSMEVRCPPPLVPGMSDLLQFSYILPHLLQSPPQSLVGHLSPMAPAWRGH